MSEGPANCRVCGGGATLKYEGRDSRYSCERCGGFLLDDDAEAVLSIFEDGKDDWRRDALSHAVRKVTHGGPRAIRLGAELLQALLQDARIETPPVQADNLILYVARREPYPVTFRTLQHGLIASVAGGRSTWGDVAYLAKLMADEGWIEGDVSFGVPSTHYNFRLTAKGWRRAEELHQAHALTRYCFMAMQFGDPDLDHAFHECFRRAVADANFELRRLDIGQPAGLIDDQLRVAIRTARFLLADLTTGNRGAYWEAGFAEGLGKPVIYLCREDAFSGIHFDTSHMLTIKWSPDALPDARRRLAATIRNTLPAETIWEGTAGDAIEVPTA